MGVKRDAGYMGLGHPHSGVGLSVPTSTPLRHDTLRDVDFDVKRSLYGFRIVQRRPALGRRIPNK